MLSHLFVLAQAAEAASHGDGGNVVTRITHNFGISFPFLIAQILNFSIVAFILWKFAFKPVLATLDARQKKIADGLRYTDEMKAKLEATQQETAAIIKQASVEAGRMVDDARRSAKDYLDKQTHETTGKVNDMLVKAREAIELEHRKMLADARTEIARLVVITTERVLAKKLTDTDRASYNDSAARELSNV